jgi:hypothetical protein
VLLNKKSRQLAEDDISMTGLCTAAMVPGPGKKKAARAGKVVIHSLGVTAGSSNIFSVHTMARGRC